MISNACATMRRVKSFLPLLRPFIIILHIRSRSGFIGRLLAGVPVNQSLDNGHLCLLELFLGITTSSVREVDCMADLNVIGQ